MEVYNDVNGNLVNLFRCVKYHPDALQKELEWVLISREQFFDCLSQADAKGLTDIQRAARFFCAIKTVLEPICDRLVCVRGICRLRFHTCNRFQSG